MNPQNQISSLDYLNQIAPKQSKNKLFGDKKMRLIAILGGSTILIFLIVGIASLVNGSPAKTSDTLGARLLATQEIAEDATSKLKNSKLRTYNSNLKLYLTNTIRDITPFLSNESTDIKKLDPKAVAAESSKAILGRLETARLNVNYDLTYAREMAFQLDSIIVLMNQLYKSAKSNNLKTFLQSSIANLQPTQQQYADFNSAS